MHQTISSSAVETMFKQLEQRRSQLTFAEKKIGAFESPSPS